MDESAEPGVVRYEVEVTASVSQAFQTFTERFNDWWPKVYTFSDDNLKEIGIQLHNSGHCYERDQQGNEIVWGQVLEWDSPERLVFSWWITPDRTVDPDPERVSEVDVRFEEVEGGTRVALEHRNISRHEGGWQLMQAAMASEQGWPLLLRSFSDLLEREPG